MFAAHDALDHSNDAETEPFPSEASSLAGRHHDTLQPGHVEWRQEPSGENFPGNPQWAAAVREDVCLDQDEEEVGSSGLTVCQH